MQFFSERRLSMLNRAVASGRILPYLGFFTLVITLIAGTVVWILTPSGFDSFGDALWWAAQTVTTVGYGDVVPSSGAGRAVAFVVMVFGVGALSLLTAVVTAAFVSYQQRRLSGESERHHAVLQILERVERRLEALEHRLS